MKKIISLVMMIAMVSTIFAFGALAEENQYKTGYAVRTSASSSASATADAEGKAAINVLYVGVILDGANKIVDCALDYVPASIAFSAEGKITSDTSAQILSKQELGADYGMAQASSLGKEWFEQADALCDYVIGKTGEEVLAIGIGDDNKATDADLLASVTVKINEYVEAIYQACENATELGAAAGDTVSIAAVNSAAGSKDAAADAAGAATLDSTFAIVTSNDSGAVTSCILDTLAATVNFDAAGQITSDVSAAISTKNQLGDSYGMKGSSALGLEWYAQAANFASLIVGKTAEEIGALDLSGADVVASATIHTDAFVQAIVKALGE